MKESTSEIIDLIGSTRLYQIHNYQKIVAYEQGNYLIIWDMDVDKKIKIHSHEYQIQGVKFFGFQNKYLVSVDGYYKVSLFISEWESMNRVCQIYLPEKKREKPVLNVILGVNTQQDQIYIVENEHDGSYRFSIWTFYDKKINLLFISETNSEQPCQDIIQLYSIQQSQQNTQRQPYDEFSSKIAVIEQNQFKIWKISDEVKQAVITNKVQLKEEIQQIKVCPLQNFIFVITISGKLLQLDCEGEFMHSKKGQSKFVSIDIFQNFAFLGCNAGNIVIYDIQSQEFINEIGVQNPWKYLFVQQIQENVMEIKQKDNETITYQQIQNNQYKDDLDLYTVCVEQLQVGDDGNTVAILYSDGRFSVFDFQKNACYLQQIGQYEKINDILWVSDFEFWTVASEGLIYKWEKTQQQNGQQSFTTRVKIVDIQKAIENLPETEIHQGKIFVENMRPQSLEEQIRYKEKYKYKICSLQEHDGIIYMADNLGNIIYMDSQLAQVFSIYKIAPYKIKKIAIITNQSKQQSQDPSIYAKQLFCCVMFNTGLSLIIDLNNQCQVQLKLESHLSIESQRLKVFKNCIPFTTQTQSNLNTQNNLQLENQNDNSLQFLAASTQNYNSVRIHTVSYDIYKNLDQPVQLSAMSKCIVQVDGLLKGFNIHPSNQYILLLSSLGYVDIFKIQHNIHTARIAVPYFSTNLELDPSGLYFSIAAPSQNSEKIHKNSPQEYNIVQENSRLKQFNNTKSLYNRKLAKNSNIQIFELGEGYKIDQQQNIFGISTIKYSPSGKYYVAGSHRGQLAVYENSYIIQENINNVFEQLKIDKFMWNSYQINIPNSIEQNQKNKNEFELLKVCDRKNQFEISDEQYQEYSRYIHKSPIRQKTRKSIQNQSISPIKDQQSNPQLQQQQNQLDYPLSHSIELSRVTGKMQNKWSSGDNFSQKNTAQNQQQQQNRKLKSILQNSQDFKQFQQNLYHQQPDSQNNLNNYNKDNEIQYDSERIPNEQFQNSLTQFNNNPEQENQFMFDRSYVKKEVLNIPQNSITAQIERSKKMKEQIRQLNFKNASNFKTSENMFGEQSGLQSYKENQYDTNILQKNIDKQDLQRYYQQNQNLLQIDNNQIKNNNQLQQQQQYKAFQEPVNIDDNVLEQGEIQRQNFQEQQIQKCYDILLSKPQTSRKLNQDFKKPEPQDIDDQVEFY